MAGRRALGHSSVGVIGGAPKCAKAWLGLDMALSVATGHGVLGRVPCRSLGRSWSTWPRTHFWSCVNASRNGKASRSGSRPGRNPRDHRRRCCGSIAIRTVHGSWRQPSGSGLGCCFWIPWCDFHGIDENNAGEVAGLLAYFRSLQRRFDLSVLLVHHTRKNAAGGVAAGQGLRGSSDIHAFGDSNLYLRRTKEHLVLSSETVQRRHQAAPVQLGVGRDQRPDDPPGGHRGLRRAQSKPSSRTVRPGSPRAASGAVSRSKYSIFWPRVLCARGRSCVMTWRSRTNAWVRRWSRSSEPAGSVARRLVGNAWTDHPRRAVPVPHKEKGNGTVLFDGSTELAEVRLRVKHEHRAVPSLGEG